MLQTKKTPILVYIIHNGIILARAERLELPTPGFGDLCSTN